ncbi:MAG: hypothetical protein ACE5FN_09955 [Leptospirillia bacterium]
MGHPTRRNLTRFTSTFHGVLAAGFVLSALIMVGLFHYDVLLRDQWAMYATYWEQPFWQSLWTPRNSHRIPFAALFSQMDLQWFGASGHVLMVLQNLLAGASAWLIARCAGEDGGSTDPALVRSVQAFVFVITFWMGSNLHLVLTLGVSHYLCALGAVVAVMGMAHAGGAARKGDRRGVTLGLAVSLAGAVVSTFSYGSGLVLWPALLVLAVVIRLPIRWAGGIAVTGIVAVALYLSGNRPAGSGEWQRAGVNHFLELFVNFLGAPAAHALDFVIPVHTPAMVTVAFVAGLAVLALTLWVSVRLLLQSAPPGRGVAALFGVLIFTTGVALLVAYSRVERYGPAVGAAQRYVSWGVLHWAALAGLLPALAASCGKRAARLAPVLCVVLVAVSLTLVPSHFRWGLASGTTGLWAEEAALALAVEVRDDARVGAALADGDQLGIVYSTGRILRDENLNFFRRVSIESLGTRLAETHRVVSQNQCLGELVTVSRASGGTPPAWRVAGWGWDTKANQAPAGVFLTDRQGMIRGLARFTRLPKNGAGELPEGVAWPFGLRVARRLHPNLGTALGWEAGWYGYTPPVNGLGAFALLADGISVCPLRVSAQGVQ